MRRMRKRWSARLLDHEVTTPVADEAACRRYYDNNIQRRFRSPDLFEAAHILISADPGGHRRPMKSRDRTGDGHP